MPVSVITQVDTSSDFLEARGLFEDYASEIAIDLCFQNFDEELDHLAEMYSLPGGCLFLAKRGSTTVGCVAVRRFGDGVCEMKRLYVEPSARGLHIGRDLAENVVARAREIGYRRMVLDTLASMTSARKLYRFLGFREIEPYYDNPLEDVVYMELDFDDIPA
jgi:ribosomal protein S18 acetylase RimI-like enzyme